MQEHSSLSPKEVAILLDDHLAIMRRNMTEVMQEKGITKVELGARIDKNKYYINYLFRHECPKPKLDNLIRISAALGMKLEDLFKK